MVVGEFTQEADLVIIGGGPAGYAAAFRAAELGVQTVVVDSRPPASGASGEAKDAAECALGGVCLFEGCIPSKTLLHAVETIALSRQAAEFGVSLGKPKVDAKALRGWVDKAIEKLAAGLDGLARKHGVERIRGRAQFDDSRTLAIRDGSISRIRFKRALIATGSRPGSHPNIPADLPGVISPEEALRFDSLPKSVLIVGGNYIAVETAFILAGLGVEVSIAFEGDRLLPAGDADMVRPVAKRLEERLKAIWLNTAVQSAEAKSQRGGPAVHVRFAGGQPPEPSTFDRVILAGPREPITGELNLAKAAVAVDPQGFIRVDEQMRTNNPRIFAAGDVMGPPLLADRALHQGRIAAEVIAGRDSVLDVRSVSHAVFTDPQIAWSGLTETDAKAQGTPHSVLKVPWGASGRAVGMGRSEGTTKIVFEPQTKVVLGVALVGVNACEMIAEGALAIEMGATLTDLASTVHPHPTCSELLGAVARLGEA